MKINPDFIAPCGLYCGVCAIHIAGRDNNQKFIERLVHLYKGGVSGKGTLPNSENLTTEDIRCRGCLSDELFMHCRQCEYQEMHTRERVHRMPSCDEFPCSYIEHFPMAVGKKVILRAVPYWREVGTEKWIEDEEARYICPECGNRVFRALFNAISVKQNWIWTSFYE
jgi:predicted nucleic-acid-binding Zn-ribbon protein